MFTQHWFDLMSHEYRHIAGAQVTSKLKMMQPNSLSLTKISQLERLVDIDKHGHKLKDIAQLFLNAANDWDTFNQEDLSDFVRELKEYFGSPLTKDRIASKTFSNEKAWRHEAGSSIIELLELSERLCNHTDFDTVVGDIFSYYEHQLQKVDFIADLKYLTSEEGGRSTPVSSGYRPQIKFHFDEMQTSGQQTFVNKENVYPGDTVEAAIKIVAEEYFRNSLTKGMAFDFREGSRVIGTGVITSIFNNKLEKASR